MCLLADQAAEMTMLQHAALFVSFWVVLVVAEVE